MSEEKHLQDLTLHLLDLVQPEATLSGFMGYFQQSMNFSQVSLWCISHQGWELVTQVEDPEKSETLFCQDFYFEPTFIQGEFNYRLTIESKVPWEPSRLDTVTQVGKHLCAMLKYHIEPRQTVSLVSAGLDMSVAMSHRLSALLEALPLGVFVENERHEMVFMNQKLAAFFGLTDIQAYARQPFRVFFRDIETYFQSPQCFSKAFVAANDQEEVSVAGLSPLTDGRFLIWDYIPLRSQGQMVGRLWSVRDITEQMLSRKEKEILSRIPQEDPNPVMRIDHQGKVLYCNTPAEYLLHYWQREVGDYLPAFMVDLVEKSLSSQKSIMEKIMFGKRTFQVIIVPLIEHQSVNFYATDVTERIRAQDEALKARDVALSSSDAKSEFLAIMSHEIRTPLNAILGMLDVLQDTQLNPEQQEYVTTSEQAGERLMGLITNLLDFSRIEAGQVTLDAVPFRLASIVDKTLAVFMLRAREKGVLLEACVEQGMPEWFKGDELRLSQILFILVDNALKFTSAGQVLIDVSGEKLSETVSVLHFTVEDTGIGVPLDKQAGVFETFAQADSSTTRRFGGSGLGLSIARQLVALFDGQIGVRSAEGGGACFYFHVCLHTPTDVEIQSASEVVPLDTSEDFKRKYGLRQTHVLIVEDSLENRLLIQAYLRKQPLELHFAHNGQEALDFCETSIPDLILMDIQMPVMDGLTATQKIRENYADVKIIVLSADALVQTREKAMMAGADFFLTKPVSRDKLLTTIDRFLSGESTEAEQASHFTDEPGSAGPADRLLADMPAFVRIEELFELLPVFFLVRQEESQLLKEALFQGDRETIKKIGHRLQGASDAYGFPYFSEIGLALEAVDDIKDLHYWVSRFDAYLTWVMDQLKDEITFIDPSAD